MTFTIIIRSLITYFIVLILLRFMGKRQIGQMQPYELVITLIIADLACIPMADTALPLVHGIIPLLTLVCVHYLLSLLERKSWFLRDLINGKPTILISPNGIEYENLKACNMNFSDLLECLRVAGYFKVDEVLYAIMQTNGALSVLPKGLYAPVTPNDMKIKVDPSSLPIIIFAEGKPIKDNLKRTKLDIDFIITQSKKAGIKNIKNIMFMTIDSEGEIYIQAYDSPATTLDTNYSGDW